MKDVSSIYSIISACKIGSPNKIISIALAIACFLHCVTAQAAEENIQNYTFKTVSSLPYESMYVSDQLTIAMRAGKGRNYKIVRYLVSGTPLDILDVSEDGNWYKVKDNNKEGWVEIKDLMAEPSAQERLAIAESNLSKGTITIDEKLKLIDELETKLANLKQTTKVYKLITTH